MSSPGTIHDPPVGATLGTVTLKAPRGTSRPSTTTTTSATTSATASTTTSAAAAAVAAPAGNQWVGDQSGHVRFAVPVTWMVIDPAKLGGISGLASSPMIKDLANRMRIPPEVLVNQMKGIKVMAAYLGTPHVNAELTTTPMSVLPSDAALSAEIGTITGQPGTTVQVVHRHSRVGDVAELRYTMMAKGMVAPVRSELATFVVQDQVWVLNVTSPDASSADRAFNDAVSTLSTW